MATVRDVLTDAFGVIGVVGEGGAMTAAQAAGGLRVFRRFADKMNADRALLGVVGRATYTWASGQSSRTIASSGADLTGPRPQWVENAAVIPNGQTSEIPLTPLLTRDAYAAIPNKAATANYFTHLLYEPTMPAGTFTGWPVPEAACTLVIYSPTAFTASALELATPLTYAPAGEEYALYEVARRLAAFYRRPWTREQTLILREAKTAFESRNRPVGRRVNDSALLTGRGTFDINLGGYR